MRITFALAAAPTVTRTVQDGFDWGSAALGAGVAVACLLFAAAALAARGFRRRTPQSTRGGQP